MGSVARQEHASRAIRHRLPGHVVEAGEIRWAVRPEVRPVGGDERIAEVLQGGLIRVLDTLLPQHDSERPAVLLAVDGPDTSTFRPDADLGLLVYDRGRWAPTPLGLERSDALGPWFFSARVRGLMAGYEPK